MDFVLGRLILVPHFHVEAVRGRVILFGLGSSVGIGATWHLELKRGQSVHRLCVVGRVATEGHQLALGVLKVVLVVFFRVGGQLRLNFTLLLLEVVALEH